MNHIGTKEIETCRLLLRKFAIGDETAMFRNWVNSYENKDFYRWAIVAP